MQKALRDACYGYHACIYRYMIYVKIRYTYYTRARARSIHVSR